MPATKGIACLANPAYLRSRPATIYAASFSGPMTDSTTTATADFKADLSNIGPPLCQLSRSTKAHQLRHVLQDESPADRHGQSAYIQRSD